MVAERGLVKFTDIFDGVSKRFEDFQFDITNQLTYQQMAGKSDAERNAATAMLIILDRGGKMSLDESKNLVIAGAEEEKDKAKCANGLLYTILALNTTGREKEFVKETTLTRNGDEAWVRLRERFSKTTGATSLSEIFKYQCANNKSFEDKCAASRMPSAARAARKDTCRTFAEAAAKERARATARRRARTKETTRRACVAGARAR